MIPSILNTTMTNSAPSRVGMELQRRVLCLDQNAWIALAQGAWDEVAFPQFKRALLRLVAATDEGRVIIPLTFTNIYETAKINDPVRREHLARVQVSLSEGRVVRGRRGLLRATMMRHLRARVGLGDESPAAEWFLSDLWFEAADDYSPETFRFTISDRLLALIRSEPAFALFDYLTGSDEAVRADGVRRYSRASADLIQRLESRRLLTAGASFAMRKRAYGAQLLIDELDFIFQVAGELGLGWSTVADVGQSIAKSLITQIPVLNVERELVVRLEDQDRDMNENDLRDMASFIAVVPVADIFVAENPFVNLARQAKLDRLYDTALLTSVTALTDAMLASGGSGSTETVDPGLQL